MSVHSASRGDNVPSAAEKRVRSPERPWSADAGEAARALGVDPALGLAEQDVLRRRERFGPNQLREHERRGLWAIFRDQFRSIIVLLLAVAAGFSFAYGANLEAVAILVVLLLNALIGFSTELRAVTSMEALRELVDVDATVRRAGHPVRVSARDLVPGDVVLVEGGDVVTADLRVFEASRLQTNEAALTGESAPVEKRVEPVPGDAPLAARVDMLYKGTAVTRGAGAGLVVATGMETELGRISSLIEEAGEARTPLEERLDRLGRRLVWLTLGIAAALVVVGLASGKDLLLIVETAIALAVAAIPEGLPIVATLALARGMWRMARRNALVERLSAVETLGACDVILTDKTGTLTENRMDVARLLLPGTALDLGSAEDRRRAVRAARGAAEDADSALRRALEVGVLCNNAALPTREEAGVAGATPAVGDPMETALLRLGAEAGIERSALLQATPEVREEAFDPDIKMMATLHRVAPGAGAGRAGTRVAVKGASEAVLEACSRIREGSRIESLSEATRARWADRSRELAGEGLRVLALAEKTTDAPDAPAYEELVFLGLVAFLDPPREDVAGSIQACRDAGIRVVMVTGDQSGTARTIARALGLGAEEDGVVEGRDLENLDSRSPEERSALLRASVFARTSPAQKLDIIALHQEAGSVVAMIGDGVNDAPSLRKADIGVAMGQRGTQVAREAADMILEDDRFSTIVAAIEQGRAIFSNIRKFVLYLLSCNVSEILVVALATAVTAPLPLRPLQILFLNLVTDVFPALALGIGDADPSAMDQPPRPASEPILARRHWEAVGAYGLLITASVLVGFWAALGPLGLGTDRAISISFSILAFAQIGHVLNMAEPESRVLVNEVSRNPWVWGAIVLCGGLVVAALRLPGLSNALGLVDPGPRGWEVIAIGAPAPLVLGRIWHLVRRSLFSPGPRPGPS